MKNVNSEIQCLLTTKNNSPDHDHDNNFVYY
jgi:hypothetical protein